MMLCVEDDLMLREDVHFEHREDVPSSESMRTVESSPKVDEIHRWERLSILR